MSHGEEGTPWSGHARKWNCDTVRLCGGTWRRVIPINSERVWVDIRVAAKRYINNKARSERRENTSTDAWKQVGKKEEGQKKKEKKKKKKRTKKKEDEQHPSTYLSLVAKGKVSTNDTVVVIFHSSQRHLNVTNRLHHITKYEEIKKEKKCEDEEKNADGKEEKTTRSRRSMTPLTKHRRRTIDSSGQ